MRCAYFSCTFSSLLSLAEWHWRLCLWRLFVASLVKKLLAAVIVPAVGGSEKYNWQTATELFGDDCPQWLPNREQLPSIYLFHATSMIPTVLMLFRPAYLIFITPCTSVAEPCRAFCLGSCSGSKIFYPRFRLRFRFLPLNFKLFFPQKFLPVSLIFVSSLASFMHVSASVPSEQIQFNIFCATGTGAGTQSKDTVPVLLG